MAKLGDMVVVRLVHGEAPDAPVREAPAMVTRVVTQSPTLVDLTVFPNAAAPFFKTNIRVYPSEQAAKLADNVYVAWAP